MMHKAWCYLEEVPYCFSRSSVKFQGHTAKKWSILTQSGRFRTVTPVSIYQWLWNDAQSLKQHRSGALLIFKFIRQISRSHGKKSPILTPIERFRTSPSLNSPMALKWCTKLHVVWKRCPIIFQGHPSNFKVTRLKKSSILTQIGRFRTVTHVWIYQWLWNDAQSLV